MPGAQVLCALVLASRAIGAVPGDADNSQDYPGFPRQHGFIISDYNEDNPAEADFPIARPLPLDAGHVEAVRVRGHRFVIRYELASGTPPSVYQTQLYYEKLAAAGGYQLAKSGAVGDVTETFCRTMANHDIWIFLEPSNAVNVLTVIEAARGSTPIASSPDREANATSPAAPPTPQNQVTRVSASAPAAGSTSPDVVPVPSTPFTTGADPDGDGLYAALTSEGRVVAPFAFAPGKDELDGSSQALIDRIVAMMKKHPDLSVRIEGHTDNTGDPEDNMRLSAQRAYAVRSRIIAGEIERQRLDAVGVGGLQPLADNATAEGREKNRRIELVVWKRYSHRETAPSSGA